MNLLDKIDKVFKEKNYDDFTKIRWIYLYICETFSYDTRYLYVTGNKKKEIYDTKVDVTNVEAFEVVCYTLARILIDTLFAFGYKADIKRETDRNLTYVYVLVKHAGYILKLDPTKRHDITRVKMNSTTIDFEPIVHDDFFSDKLLETDKKISSSFDGLYFLRESALTAAEHCIDEINTYAKENKLSSSEIFFKKLNALYEMLNSRDDLKRYDDIDFYYSYLLRCFKINIKEQNENGITTYVNHSYVKPVVLINKNDKSMRDIINISYIQYDDLPPVFYLLKKENDAFRIREIFKDEALELLNQYESPFCQYMLEEAAKNLSNGKQNDIII